MRLILLRSGGAAFLLIAFSATAWAAGSTVVKPPCTDSSELGLKSCKEYLDLGTPGVPGVIRQLDTAVKTQIDPVAPAKGYYQHVDPSYDLATQQAGQQFFGPTLCNVAQGESLAQSEKAINRKGESCGKPVHIGIRYSVNKVAGCATSDPRPVPVVIHKQYDPADPLNSPGLLEDGYSRGSVVQATQCFHQLVAQELRSSHQLTVADINGSPSPCAGILTQFQSLSGQYRNSVDNLKGKLAGQPNFADIVNCKKGWDTSLGNSPDVGPLRQSSQQLCAARQAIEGMFAQLAACEILARSQAAYVNLVSSSSSQQRILTMLQSQIAGPCSNQCTQGASWCNVPDDTTVERCANTCYQEKMPTVFRSYIQGHWPSNGSKCDLSMNEGMNDPVFLLIGMLGWARGKKRARRRFRLPRAAQALAGLALATQAALLGACGKGKDTKTVNPMPTAGPCLGLIETQAIACCHAPDSPSCSTHTPGDGGIAFHQAGAVNAGAAAAEAIKHANALLGPPKTDVSTTAPPVLAQGSAATASDKSAPGGGGSTPVLATGRGPSSDFNMPATPPSGGGGAAPSGSGASAGLTGNLKTSDLSDPSNQAQQLGAVSAHPELSAGGQYKGGEGGTGGGSGGGSLFLAGANGGALAGESQPPAEESFSPDMNGTTARATAASEDPLDYFTRLGLGDNLFKVVERRYRATSTSWISRDLDLR